MNTETTTAEDKAFVAGLAKKARAKRAGKSAAKAKETKPKKAGKSPEADSKKDIILALLRRKEGATLAEIAEATGWQNHSIHGFMSGHIRKKMGLTVASRRSMGTAPTA